MKTIHLALGAIWLGAGVSMFVLRLVWMPSGHTDLYALNYGTGLINDWIVIPTALASLLTGLLSSWLTPWGFFKHRWVTAKWILTVAVIVGSPLITTQWDRELEAISSVEGLMALQNPVYLHYQALVNGSGAVKVAILFAITAISVLKPWRTQVRAATRAEGR